MVLSYSLLLLKRKKRAKKHRGKEGTEKSITTNPSWSAI